MGDSNSFLHFIWGIVCWNICVLILTFCYKNETENIKDRIRKDKQIYVDSIEYRCKVTDNE